MELSHEQKALSPFLKPETKRSSRERHERTMAQWSVVQEGSLSASPSRFDGEAICLHGFQGTQESRTVKAQGIASGRDAR